jgi:hypothetical protein
MLLVSYIFYSNKFKVFQEYTEYIDISKKEVKMGAMKKIYTEKQLASNIDEYDLYCFEKEKEMRESLLSESMMQLHGFSSKEIGVMSIDKLTEIFNAIYGKEAV